MGKKVLAAFLEKDNLKLLVCEISGGRAARQFAGQITFSPDVVKDAFIAEPAKFAGQVKIAFAQKPIFATAEEAVLFIPPDKVFTKTLPVGESVETFVRTLPYFKEELILSSEERGGKADGQVTQVAFEKKLVEDFERPFLESGKRVLAVLSSINVLARFFRAEGTYFLLVPFEKEFAIATVTSGAVGELTVVPKDAFLGRFTEFIAGKNLTEIKKAYTLGTFDTKLVEKLQSERGLTVESLAGGDIYDLTVGAYQGVAGGGGLGAVLSGRFSGKRPVIAAALVLVGLLLIFSLGSKFPGKISLPGLAKKEVPKPAVQVPPPPPAPEPKPSDYKIRVLNGTLVTGEAAALGQKLKGLGFDVVETKNATSSGFVTTLLRRTTEGVPLKITEMLKSTLSDIYESVSLETMASDSAGVRVEIIIGKKK